MKRCSPWLFCVAAAAAHAQAPELTVPRGGWRATVPDNNFVQEVHYPASSVNLRSGVSVAAQISGSVRDRPKKGPSTLVVNGVPMPVETDEAGSFARPYAFAAGSNSVEVRGAPSSPPRRVQFYDVAAGGARPRLRVVLSWDTAGTDMDLHVITPSGQHCFYANRVIAGGGALDVDVTSGYGPEIFATARPERGTWLVYVNYYGGGGGHSMSIAQVTVIEGEGTPSETRRMFRVPLRSTGDLEYVASFSVL